MSSEARAAKPIQANPIQVENAKPGDTAWEHSYSSRVPDGTIDGYASQDSVAPGGTLDFHVNSPKYPYRIEISRLGWYGGQGGRLVACIPSCAGTKSRISQPSPPAPDAQTGIVRAGWSVTDTLTVPSDWVSGYYIAAFVVDTPPGSGFDGEARRYDEPFIVTAPNRHSRGLFQVPDMTWQAYNAFGGKSLYDHNSTGNVRANRVSFARPLGGPDFSPVWGWEYQLVRFLEREGIDVAYATDVDVHRNPAQLLEHRFLVSAGHDEYWTKSMLDGWIVARNAGVNLVFMGGNATTWQARLEDRERTLVVYRDAAADPNTDPALETVQWRDPPVSRPECELRGVQWRGGQRSHGASGNVYDYTVTAQGAAQPWMSAAGFQAGKTLTGTVGYEWDSIQPGCNTPPLTTLFHWTGSMANPPGPKAETSDAVLFTAPSGAKVFSSGSLQFSWGLDSFAGPSGGSTANPRLQDFVWRMLADFGGPPAPVARLASLSISPTRLITRPRRGHPAGATIRFRLSSAASVTFTVQRVASGRRRNVRCKPPARRNAGKPRCTRLLPVAGRIVHRGRAGDSALRFTGRTGRHALALGSYQLVARVGTSRLTFPFTVIR